MIVSTADPSLSAQSLERLRAVGMQMKGDPDLLEDFDRGERYIKVDDRRSRRSIS